MSLATGIFIDELEAKDHKDLMRYHAYSCIRPLLQNEMIELMLGTLTQYVQFYSDRGPKQASDVLQFMPYKRYESSLIDKKPAYMDRDNIIAMLESIKARHGK